MHAKSIFDSMHMIILYFLFQIHVTSYMFLFQMPSLVNVLRYAFCISLFLVIVSSTGQK